MNASFRFAFGPTALAAVAGLWLGHTSLPAASAPFRAGAAMVDISPQQLPVRTAGNFTETVADKIYDPLHVRALVLEDGSVRVTSVFPSGLEALRAGCPGGVARSRCSRGRQAPPL